MLCAAGFRPLVKPVKLFEAHVIDLISLCKQYQEKCYAFLGFEILHEIILMLMNICESKNIFGAFFRIKAHRIRLDDSYVVYSAALLKICQRDMPVVIYLQRFYGSGNLLDKCKAHLPVFFIYRIYLFFELGTSQSSGAPGCHRLSPFKNLFMFAGRSAVTAVPFRYPSMPLILLNSTLYACRSWAFMPYLLFA